MQRRGRAAGIETGSDDGARGDFRRPAANDDPGPEARQDELNERLAAVPADIPDIHPNIAIVYRRKVERLAAALADPRDRAEGADAITDERIATLERVGETTREAFGNASDSAQERASDTSPVPRSEKALELKRVSFDLGL